MGRCGHALPTGLDDMALGIAGGLLVFTGLWHAFEWMMGGRNKDTLRLIPFGLAYLTLGYLIVTGAAGMIVLLIALSLTCVGLVGALMTRRTAAVRPWVTWAFIMIDVVIILALLLSLLG